MSWHRIDGALTAELGGSRWVVRTVQLRVRGKRRTIYVLARNGMRLPGRWGDLTPALNRAEQMAAGKGAG